MFFLSNLIIVLLISIYFTFNLFSDWILSFDFIPNHLILISFFFVEFNLHSYYCNSFIFLVLVVINFFWQWHHSLFNFIKFSYHIWCLFFIMFFKTSTRVDFHHVSSHGLGRMTKVIGVNQIFYCAWSRNDIILIKNKIKSTGFNIIFPYLII